jgi:hypothetical protein
MISRFGAALRKLLWLFDQANLLEVRRLPCRSGALARSGSFLSVPLVSKAPRLSK